MDWYYTSDSQQQGPVSFESLKELAQDGTLKPGDLVWNTDMGDQWQPASSIPDLFKSEPRERATDFAPPPGGERVAASCVSPVGPAWDAMKNILFRPLDMGKWFVLGFTAFLATLGEGGGGSFNAGDSADWEEITGVSGNADPQQVLEGLRSFFQEYAGMILAIGGGILLVCIIVGLILMWLQCRGMFMFLDNVVHDRAEIVYGWKTFKQHANSLFLWRFVYGIVCFAVFMILLVIGFFSVAEPLFQTNTFTGLGLVFGCNIGLWVLIAIIMSYIGLFLEGFVVPIMYNHDLTATEAWSRFLGLLSNNFGKFVLFGIFYFLLVSLWVTCIIILIPCTLCILGCLLAIPYIGTVALLPMIVFFRLYTLGYLEQFGPEYLMRLESGGGEASAVEATA